MLFATDMAKVKYVKFPPPRKQIIKEQKKIHMLKQNAKKKILKENTIV